MVGKSKEPSEVYRVREAIRLLNLALNGCHRYLAEAEEAVRQTHQDNERPALR